MKKILIVHSDYYPEISNELKKTAIETLKEFNVTSIKSPGVFEIPVIIARNIEKYDACIALGCVIKGETPHFDYISTSATNGIMSLSINCKKPIGNGILTCLNKDQATQRVKKGAEAAKAVIQVLADEH
jgi:6,7-dimethyl-8-ribityllumazine synthase